MYTAAVLTPYSIDLLVCLMRKSLDLEKAGFVLKTPSGERLPHHMTINLGAFDSDLNPLEMLKQPVRLVVDSFWYSEEIGACAARVIEATVNEMPVRTINDETSHKHITVCLRPPAKPLHSNKLFQSNTEVSKIDGNCLLVATLQEVR